MGKLKSLQRYINSSQFLIVSAVLLLVLMVCEGFVDGRSIVITPEMESLSVWGGKAYSVDLNIPSYWKPFVQTDSVDHPQASNLKVWIDGEYLSHPHSRHDELSELGDGRFSHWNGVLIFTLPNSVEWQGESMDIRLSAKTYILESLVVFIKFCFLGLLWVLLKRALVERDVPIKADIVVDGVFFLCLSVFICAWFAAPPALILWPDSLSYMMPALSAMSGGGLDLVGGRSSGYPAYLAVVLQTGSLNAVVYSQLFLLALSIVLLWLAAKITLRFLKVNSELSAFIALGLAILPMSYFTLSLYTHAVMPETLYQFLAVLTLASLVALHGVKTTYWKSYFISIVAVFASTATYYVKPHWAGSLIFTWLVVGWLWFYRDDFSLRSRFFGVLSMLLMTVVVVHHPATSVQKKYDPDAGLFGAQTLFCNHIELVETELAEQFDNDLLVQEIQEKLDLVRSMPADGWNIHGYSGDHCFYKLKIPDYIAEQESLSNAELKGVLMRLFVSGVLSNPGEYLEKIYTQFVAGVSNSYIKDSVIKHPAPVRNTFDAMLLREDYQSAELTQTFYDEPIYHPLSGSYFNFSSVGRYVLDKLDDNALRIFLLTLLAFVLDLILSRKRLGGCVPVFSIWGGVIISTGLYFSSLSVVAASHTFDVQRYSQFSSMLAMFYQCFALVVISIRVKYWCLNFSCASLDSRV